MQIILTIPDERLTDECRALLMNADIHDIQLEGNSKGMSFKADLRLLLPINQESRLDRAEYALTGMSWSTNPHSLAENRYAQ